MLEVTCLCNTFKIIFMVLFSLDLDTPCILEGVLNK